MFRRAFFHLVVFSVSDETALFGRFLTLYFIFCRFASAKMGIDLIFSVFGAKAKRRQTFDVFFQPSENHSSYGEGKILFSLHLLSPVGAKNALFQKSEGKKSI